MNLMEKQFSVNRGASKKQFPSSNIVLLLAILWCAGCATNTPQSSSTRLFDRAKISQIKPGSATKQDVLAVLGAPSSRRYMTRKELEQVQFLRGFDSLGEEIGEQATGPKVQYYCYRYDSGVAVEVFLGADNTVVHWQITKALGSSPTPRPRINSDKLLQIKQGVTHSDEVIAILGVPELETVHSTGKKNLMYLDMTKPTRLGFLPSVILGSAAGAIGGPGAAFGATADTPARTLRSVYIDLSTDGIVQRVREK